MILMMMVVVAKVKAPLPPLSHIPLPAPWSQSSLNLRQPTWLLATSLLSSRLKEHHRHHHHHHPNHHHHRHHHHHHDHQMKTMTRNKPCSGPASPAVRDLAQLRRLHGNLPHHHHVAVVTIINLFRNTHLGHEDLSQAVDGDEETCSFTPRTLDQRWWQIQIEATVVQVSHCIA